MNTANELHGDGETSDREDTSGQAVIVPKPGYSVEVAIEAWLESKYQLSRSQGTCLSYQGTLHSFQQALEAVGLSVTSPLREVSLVLGIWAGFAPRGRRGSRYRRNPAEAVHEAAPNTYNQRLAVISSFYQFVRRRDLLPVAGNPVEFVERSRVPDYDAAQPLPLEVASDLLERLRAAYPQSVRAKRDYVLIAIALQTGRRLAELANLRWSDVRIDALAEGDVVTLTFRAKGGKTLRNQLPVALSVAFLGYIRAVYGPDGVYWHRPSAPDAGSIVVAAGGASASVPSAARGKVPDDLRHLDSALPIWISLAHDGSLGHPLSRRSISYLCKRRVGTGKFHVLRHTFAHSMDEVGAGVSTIQQQLGHSSLATTGRYLTVLGSAKNPLGDKLAQRLGTNQTPSVTK